MDKEKLEARLADLQQSLKQIEANGNAMLGAIEECKYWLAQLEEKEAPKSKDKGAG
jgi:hypothetical protein